MYLLWWLVCVVVFLQWFAAIQGWTSRRRRRTRRLCCSPSPAITAGGKKTGPYPDCNFTNGLGGWANNNYLTWIPINHALKNDHGILTGRQGDKDSYSVINYNSSSHRKGGEAKMYSHYITGPVCMKFFFHLHGRETGFLKILTKRKYYAEKTVFYRYGNHGHQWNFGQVYLDFRSTDVYQIAISGVVGNASLRSSPAIDDISFENRTCEQIPQDKAFNCSFDNSRCGWTTSGEWLVGFEQEINQYSIYAREIYWNNVMLKSPRILSYQGCFSFQYRAEPDHYSNMGRLFVFVVDGNKEKMPVWNMGLFYGSAWRTVEIQLNFTTGFTQIVVEGLSLDGKIYFANIALYSGIEKCKSVEERTFFASSSLSQPTKYFISNDGVSCYSYPVVSSFIARVLPSAIFTKPIYFYSWYSYTPLSYQISVRDYGELLGHFYVSTSYHTDTSPVYYSLRSNSKERNYFYISTFGSNPPGNTTHEVFYVKNWEVNLHCLPGWFEITGKCLKLVCSAKSWHKAQDECSKIFSALASFNDTSLRLVTQYFERLQISFTGYTTVSVGSTRADRQWWRDDQAYNESLGLLPLKARLVWDRTSGKWKIEQSDSINKLYLCEKQRANVAFRSMTNQSSTKSHYSSDLAVDGISSTCSVTQKTSQPSWWQVTLALEIKIYFIKLLSSSSEQNEVSLYVNADGVFDNNTSTTCEKIVYLTNRASTVICEPPMNGRYVEIETKERTLELCEIEVYGTESLTDLRGVSRAFWSDIRGDGLKKLTENKNYPSHPDFYHVIPTFDAPKHVANYYGQVLEAYFLPQKSGNYTFFLAGDDDAEFYIYSGRKTNVSSLSTIILEYYVNAYVWDRYPKQRSPALFLYACQFYFLKVLMKEIYGLDHVSVGIQNPNGSYEKPMTGKNLFWILPGQLQVEFSLNRNTIKDVTIGQPFSITGTYMSHCLGIYCGDCPLAIFLTFERYFKCVLLPSQNDAQKGCLSLALKTWFLPSGSYEILMGYQTNGNCSIITNTVDLNFEANVNFSVIGSVFVKPIILVSCQFKTPKFCVNVDQIRNDGWRRIKLSNDDSRYSLGGLVNKTASFSLKWVENEVMKRTGICVRFQYKVSGENNSLSLSFQTFSGKTRHLWSLRGYHGDQWHDGFVSFQSDEKLMFVFEARVIYPNTTVAIADVIVMTKTCPSHVNPPYAEPGHQCENGRFSCANGQCIASDYICDGDENCLDGSDEKSCQCLTRQFKCRQSGECISKRLFCDGDQNCGDGSDEENCYTVCTPDEYYNCPSGQCLPWNSTCNGVWDCLDGADEPDICGLSLAVESSNTTCSLNYLDCAAYSADNNSFCSYVAADCDFEEGLCAWSQLGLPYDNFNWVVNTGKTSSKGTGPVVDHTTHSDTGKYIFIEASFPRVAGDVAILEAGPFEGGKNICVTFYYHMFGKDIGSLDIYKHSMNKSELLWTRNGSETVRAWRRAWFNVESNNDYDIFIQATCGNGALGDTAIDDISMINKNCAEVNDAISPFCSVKRSCSWNTNYESWRPRQVNESKLFILQNYYVEITQSTYFSTFIKGSLAETYQCMSFWYKYFTCPGMLLDSSQTVEGRKLQISFKLSDEHNEKWKIAEMPLRRSLKEYMVRLDVTIPLGSSTECFFGIDAINFSVEPCLSFQQGGPVWIRKSFKFYKSLKKLNENGSITAFYNPPSAPGFFSTMKTNYINSIVDDIAAVNYSKIPLSARVFVESDSDYDAVIGTVIKNDTIKSPSDLKTRYRLTIRLDSDGKDLVIETQKVWLLPFQLDRRGPLWRDASIDWGTCENNGFCYGLSPKQINWYDGVDYCKQFGGDIVSFESGTVENMIRNRFSKHMPFWIGYHGHKHAGYQFEWSDGSKVFYNRMVPLSLTQGVSAGLCAVVERTAWIRRNCSEDFYVVCKRPGKQTKIICGNDGYQNLTCTDPGTALFIHVASLRQEKSEMARCHLRFSPCSRLTISRTKVYNEVKSKCHGRTWCSLSAKNMISDPCQKYKKYLEISYSCLVMTNTDISKDNSVLCPEGWVSFRSSCYQFNNTASSWEDADKFCASKQGATLVTLNDEQEEQFVKTLLKTMGSHQFWIALSDAKYRNSYSSSCVKVTDKGLDSSSCSDHVSSVCEYSPAPGSCDFEANWCGWQDKHSNKNESHWERKFIQINNLSGGKSYSIKDLMNWWTSKAPERAVVIYVSKYRRRTDGVLNLRAEVKEDLSKLTVCLWLYPYTNNTEATVINFREEEGLRIFFKNNTNFMIDMQEWNTTTNASVSFETWQHICFSIDTSTSVWSFYKDGLLTDIGLSNVSRRVSRVIDLGGEAQYCVFVLCYSFRQFLGKITKPNMWSKILNTRQVAMVSTGCGVVSSGDITISQTHLTALKVIIVSDDECVPGKGFRLMYRNDNLSPNSTSSLVSSWMKSSHGTVIHGVCVTFVYRLLGQFSEMKLSVEPKYMNEEVLWKVKNTEESALWKWGQVFLGFSSEFRVHISATLIANNSEVNIDNVFFKEGFCDPIPRQAQEWKTYIYNSSSGFLTSPYYPSYYLNNMRREWEIIVPVGQQIKFNFLFLNLDEDCDQDSIMFQDGGRSQLVLTYCGNILPPKFISHSNIAKIIFKSDAHSVRTGFKIHYEAVDATFYHNQCGDSDYVSNCPANIHCYYLNSNKTKVFLAAKLMLFHIPPHLPENISGIDFDGNYLTNLKSGHFENMTNLEYLSLRRNQIAGIEKETFVHSRSLQTLCLAQNYIERIPDSLFNETRSLKVLDLSMNAITEFQTGLFLSANNIRVLSLRRNKLESLDYGAFSGLYNLQYLYLDENRLSRIDSEVFKGLGALKALILKDNKLRVVKASWLRGMTHLRKLNLHNNALTEIEPGAFNDLKHLTELDLSKNHIQNIPESLFNSLDSLRSLKVDHFTLCCYAKQSRPSVSCSSQDQDGFSSCDELLKNKILKYSIWVLGVMAFAGNLVVIVWRVIAKDSNRVNSFLLTNLAVADFLMGVYMLIIAYKNTVWHGVYFKHDISWRASDLCIFAGIVSTISSEVSVFTLSVITLDRLICIVFPFRCRRFSMKKAAVIMVFVWLLGSAIALAPLFNKDYFYDYNRNVHFFGRSAVCLPLQLSSDRPAGWHYSVSIFIFFNGLAFLFILLAYIVMYRSIMRAANAVRSTRMNQDSTLAKRMMFIIMTDFFCWVPVIIISILSLTGNLHDPRKEVYAWIAVFVLPINSSINPLLYTFSTPFVRKKINSANNPFSALSVIAKTRRRDVLRGRSRSFLSNSFHSNFDSTITVGTPASTPQSLRKLEVINEAFMPDEEGNAESSFIESSATSEYCVKFIENVEMFTTEGITKKSFVALEETKGEEEKLCFVDVYKNEDENLWRNTTKILSWLSVDNDQDNILPFLWSARASKVLIKNEKFLSTSKIELEPDDCLICYELPSKQTLQDFLDKNDFNLTEDVVYAITKDLIQSIDYLSSKKIAHNAILPCNIIITKSLQSQVITAILGGLSCASFVTSLGENSDEQQLTNDVESFGNILKILLETFPASEQHAMTIFGDSNYE